MANKFKQEFKKVVEEAKPEVKTPEPGAKVMSFERYFASTGKPAHHKAGMASFANTKNKKTLEAWNALFKSY